MSYRYTAAKKQQANRKFAQKQLRKRGNSSLAAAKSGAKSLSQVKNSPIKGVKVKNNASSKKIAPNSGVAKRTTKKVMVRVTGQKKTAVKAAKKVNWWQQQSLTWLGSLAAVILFGYLIFVLLMRFFLPALFNFSEEKNILLVGAAPSETAERIYILRLSPTDESVKVFLLDNQASVPVVGDYGNYPLGSVAPLLQLETNNSQQNLLAVYNFALKQAIDEVYFVPNLQIPDTAAAVRVDFWTLIKKELTLTTTVRRELWEIFFYLQRGETAFTVKDLKITAQEGLETTALAKERINACPAVLINTTGINGLAGKVTKMVEMSGVVVVNLESSAENLEESEVYYDQNEPACQELVAILQNSLPKMGKIVPDNGVLGGQNRAKLVLKIGRSLSN